MAGGYDPSLFVDAVDDEFICAICQCVYRDPVMLPCQHTYCKYCIIACLDASNVCPLCRHVINRLQPLPVARMATNLTAKLRMYCKYRSSTDCPFTGKMADLERHEANCDYQPMMCPNSTCGRMIACRFYQHHRSACDRTMQLVKEFYTLHMMPVAKRNGEEIRKMHLQLKAEIKIKFASQADYLTCLDAFLDKCLQSFKLRNTLRGVAAGAVSVIAVGAGVALATIPMATAVAPVVALSGVIGGVLGGIRAALRQK